MLKNKMSALSFVDKFPGVTAIMCKGKKRGCIGLVFTENFPSERWSEFGMGLEEIYESIQFMIGDWINFGEKKAAQGGDYVTPYKAAREFTGFTLESLDNWARVSRQVPKPLRNGNLKYSHHVAVAPLKEDEQIKFLTLAELGTAEEPGPWPVTRLREAIRDANKMVMGGSSNVTGFMPGVWVRDLCRELNRIDFKSLDAEKRAELKAELLGAAEKLIDKANEL